MCRNHRANPVQVLPLLDGEVRQQRALEVHIDLLDGQESVPIPKIAEQHSDPRDLQEQGRQQDPFGDNGEAVGN